MIGITTNLTESEWRLVGQYANQLIQDDMERGIFQTPDGSSNKPKYNEQYAKYKANEMRRFTKEYKSGTKKAKTNKKTGATTGNRLKAYYGKSIENTDVSKVTMILTGQTRKSLKVKQTMQNGVKSGFDSEHTRKIEGNNRFNRLIVGLNAKNIELVKQKIIELLKARLIEASGIKIQVKMV